MKKLILSVAAVFAFGFANAQEETTEGGFSNGDVFISGAVGFGSSKTGDVKKNAFEVSPSVGFFVSPNIALGARLGYASETNDNGTVEQTQDTFSIGAFGRYYVTPAAKFSLFGELAVDYATSKVDDGLPLTDDSKANGFGVQLAPGVSYFLARNFAIEATWGLLGYSSTKPDFDGAESTDNFAIGLNLRNINFGLVYKF